MISLNIDELKKNQPDQRQKDLFPHQVDAIGSLNHVFDFGDSGTKGALLVFPTGAGKTFTAVKWLLDNVVSQNVKILWLAHTFHLLDQAYATFCANAQYVDERATLNIRRVSSQNSHDKPATIDWSSDDVLIMSTLTAIANMDVDASDLNGKPNRTNFQKFVESCAAKRLFVVLDEAHHAPAYGCRHLLERLRKAVPRLYLLGLTATPTYTDEKKRGWLGKIFEQPVISDVKPQALMAQKILARPNFIQMPTGRNYTVSDQQYKRLIEEHKDVEDIIQKLADDDGRNDFIVNEYVEKRTFYGKTLIFADRWYQCVYLKEKLLAAGVKADAVYAHVDADPGSVEARKKRTSSDNQRILQEFKDDKHEVLLNVRMLTEGTDVPDIKTVFVTRQTTSSILMTQMIGRALRGEKAGGGPNKSDANIVLFVDEWKRLINWATPSLEGGTVVDESPVERYPMRYISIRLIEEIVKQINSGIVFQPQPFLNYLPVGWYLTDLVIDTSEDTSEGKMDEMQTFHEFVMVYDHTKPKFDKFIQNISSNLPDSWAKERLTDDETKPQASGWIANYFDKENDDIGATLEMDLIRIARHIAQNSTPPEYYLFEERDKHDLDRIAEEVVRKEMSDLAKEQLIRQLYNQPGTLWQTFYRTLDRFRTAFSGAVHRQVRIIIDGPTVPTLPVTDGLPPDYDPHHGTEPPEDVKEQVFVRDNYTCQACGAEGKRFRLQADHIVPVKFGGGPTINNLQTLCKVCNGRKSVNAINFKILVTPLSSPKERLDLLQSDGGGDVRRSITRMVNFFYHCQAVCEVRMNKRVSGKFYSTWEIELYDGNDPNWLLQHKAELLNHIKSNLNRPHVLDVRVIGPLGRDQTEKPIGIVKDFDRVIMPGTE